VVHHDWKQGPRIFYFYRGCMVVVTFQSVFRVKHIKKILFLKLAHQNNLKYNKKLIFNKKNLNFKKHGCF
jgi:hypothetical protein